MPKIGDITVPSIGLGLMSLGHAYGHAGTDEERLAVSINLLHMFWLSRCALLVVRLCCVRRGYALGSR